MTMTKRHMAVKATLGLLIAFLVASGSALLGPSSASAAVLVDSDTVRVQSGDTLSGIASAFLGDASRWPEIADLNDIEDPDLIFPGQLLDLPEAVSTPPTTTPPRTDDGRTIIIDRSDDMVRTDDGFGDLFQWILLMEVLDDEGEDRDLVELILLSQLFGGSGDLFSGNTDQGFGSLFQWIIISDVLSDDDRSTDRDQMNRFMNDSEMSEEERNRLQQRMNELQRSRDQERNEDQNRTR